VLVLAGCGYHQVGAAAHIPANVRTVGVPIFASKVQAYNTETAFTQAMVRELNARTNYRVETGASADQADAVLRGTIVAETVAPLTYDSTTGQTSSYPVLYKNDAFAWREQYQSTEDFAGFVQEDGDAVHRMSKDFAQAVVSDMLESFR